LVSPSSTIPRGKCGPATARGVSFSWPGALGTSWFADPVEDMIGLFMIQRRARRAVFRLAQEFERLLYDAIDD